MEKIVLLTRMDQEMESQGYTKIMALRDYDPIDLVDKLVWSEGWGDMFLYGKSLGSITIFKIGKCFANDFEVYDIEKIGNRTIYIEESNNSVQVNARIRVNKDLYFYFNFIY